MTLQYGHLTRVYLAATQACIVGPKVPCRDENLRGGKIVGPELPRKKEFSRNDCPGTLTFFF